jgi:6-phosphogluconate dehydrogenase (decarboxylating)
MRVGWLGLGAMGAPMAACLVAAGHSVSAYDVVPDRAPQGASAAASVPEAVTGADAIVVMVATPDQLDQVLSSAAPCLAPRQTVAIMSTVGPEAVAAAAARLEAAGVAVVDAPVSGGVTRAGQGDLLILVASLDRVAGAGTSDRIDWSEDPRIGAIVRSWPAEFRTPRAGALGLRAEDSFDEIVCAYLADNLGAGS